MKREKKRNLQALAFAVPAILILGIFVYFPLIENFIYSFQSFPLSSATKEWVGFDNYRHLFSDKIILVSLKNNILYAVISIVIQVGFGLVLAAVLEDIAFHKFAPALRSIYSIPTVISMTVVCLLFDFVYNPQMGLLNSFLELVGLDGFTRVWLGSKKTAMYAVIAVSQWQSTGYVAMLFIVAIQKIPRDLYEAAEVDGASAPAKFFKITLPLLTPTIFFNLVMQMINGFLAFTQSYIITQGKPMNSTLFYTVYMYQQSFEFYNTGYGAALAWVMLAIIGLITLFLFATKRFWVYEGGL